MPSPLESLYFKIWITTVILLWSFQALQGKNFKGSLKTDSELIAILKIKPGQKLCRNCIKKATEVTEHRRWGNWDLWWYWRGIPLFTYKQFNIKWKCFSFGNFTH